MMAIGRRPAIPAVARALAEPVVWVIHHMRTNWVRELPMRERLWPPKKKAKFLFQELLAGDEIIMLGGYFYAKIMSITKN
jgi:hypothetical protein